MGDKNTKTGNTTWGGVVKLIYLRKRQVNMVKKVKKSILEFLVFWGGGRSSSKYGLNG